MASEANQSQAAMKLLILALDGFDPELFEKWRGQLPHLNAIGRNGIFSPLGSTLPPMTFPAWSTFLTGVNPGQHGIFDFTERLPGRLGVRFLNATRRRLPTFLNLLSQNGLRVGSIGLPTTYPPEPLNGYQISGFDTPIPSKADASYVYPQELAGKIDRRLGGFFFGSFNESRVGQGWHSRVFGQLLDGIRRKGELVRFLQDERPVDVMLLHVGETDTVGHHFWSFCDPQSPRHVRPDVAELSEAILSIYQRADALIGELMEQLQPDSLLIASDHGMGGTSDRVLYLNRFLSENGFLTFLSGTRSQQWAGRTKNLGLKWIPYRYQQSLFKLASGHLANRLESWHRFGGLNWSRTQAYSDELNYFPSIWLNRAGREPDGIVPASQVESLTSEIKSALLGWRDPWDNTPVIAAVHRREEIYSGSEVAFAPDFILELHRPKGYGYALGKSSDPQAASPWRRLASDEYLGFKGASMNGSHRSLGCLLALTEPALPQPEEIPNMQDCAPTILSLLGLAVPTWMEGRSLTQKWDSIDSAASEASSEYLYNSPQEQILDRKLRQLGYLS